MEQIAKEYKKIQENLQESNAKNAELRRQNDELIKEKAQLVQENAALLINKSKLEQEMIELGQQKDADIQKLHKNFKEQQAAEEERQRQATEALKATHRARLAEETEEHKKILDSERQKLLTELEAVRKSYRKDLDEQRDNYIEKVRSLEHQLEEKNGQLEEFKKKQESELGALLSIMGSPENTEGLNFSCGPEICAPLSGASRTSENESVETRTDVKITGELRKLQEKLAEAETEVRLSSVANKELKEQVKQLEQQLGNEQQMCLTDLKFKYKEQLEQLERLQMMEQQHLKCCQVEENLKQQIIELTEQNKLMTSNKTDSLREATEEVRRLKGRINELETQLAKERDQTERTLQRKQAELVEVQQSEEASRKELQSAHEDRKRQAQRAKDLEVDLNNFRRQAGSTERDLQKQLLDGQMKVGQLQDAIKEMADRLQKGAEEQDGRIAEWMQEKEIMYNRICSEGQARKNSEEELKRTEVDLANSRRTSDDLRERLEEQQRLRTSSEMKLQAAMQKGVKSIEVAENLRRVLDAEKNKCNQLESSVQKLQQENARLMQNQEEIAARERNLKNQLDDKVRRLDEAQRSLKQASDFELVCKENIKQLEEDFKRERADKEELRRKRDQLQKECDELRDSLYKQMELVAQKDQEIHGQQPHGQQPHGQQPHGQQPHGQQPHGQQQQQRPQSNDAFFKKYQKK